MRFQRKAVDRPWTGRTPGWGFVALTVCACRGQAAPELDECSQQSTELFEERIEPILTDERPASCNQCHLSGIDLTLLARDTPCETLACLVEDGLVDLDDPDGSVVLDWIARAEPESELITEEVIQAEYDAFAEWIRHAASCGACSQVDCGARDATGVCDLEVEPSVAFALQDDPGDCSDRTMEGLFLETIYVSRGRCYPCHFESAGNRPAGAFPWIVETDHCEGSSLATLRNVVKLGYIDVDDWRQSSLLTKPLAESDGGVEHGGHDKFTMASDDPVYDNYLYFLERYSDCAGEP